MFTGVIDDLATTSLPVDLIINGGADAGELRYRASAAMAKGATMAAFGLWVVGTVVWHVLHATLPSAFTMAVVSRTTGERMSSRTASWASSGTHTAVNLSARLSFAA